VEVEAAVQVLAWTEVLAEVAALLTIALINPAVLEILLQHLHHKVIAAV
jgi:hypothetical protein